MTTAGSSFAAAESSADNPVRWVHISEHEDPTPWLSGGELLLTTGYNLGTPARQRRYVELLAGEGIAGLGFGTGFDHKRLPKAICEASAEHGLPLFEVPYEMPFIAITERASARLINEQFGVLERGVQVHERLERLVIEGQGLDEILAATGAAIGGTAIVIDRAGHELARGGSPIDGDAVEELATELAGRASRAPRPPPSRPRRATSPAGRWPCRSPVAVAARRRPGSRWSPRTARSATSSASAPARRRSSWGSS